MAGNAVIGQSGAAPPNRSINRRPLARSLEAPLHRPKSRPYRQNPWAKHGVRGIIQNEFRRPRLTSPRPPSNASPRPLPPPWVPPATKPDGRLLPENLRVLQTQWRGISSSHRRQRLRRYRPHHSPKWPSPPGVKLHVYHIPRPIQITTSATTDHCPGYGSAARFVALAHQGDDADNRSLKGIKINNPSWAAMPAGSPPPPSWAATTPPMAPSRVPARG